MYFIKLALANFRNYEKVSVENLHPKRNLIVGENANGKTNFIEALNFLSSGKSFRGAPDEGLIRAGQETAYIGAEFLRKNSRQRMQAALLKRGRKSIRINGQPIGRMIELLGVANTVVFAPEDIKAVKEAPALRRRLMDLEISKLYPAYYTELQRYHALIKDKNKLLKERETDETLLFSYNQPLARCSAAIIRRRQSFCALLAQKAGEIHHMLSGEKEVFTLRYRSSVEGEDLEAAMENKLARMLTREREMGVSLVGPHREDLEFLIDGRDIRVYASQGQQRTAMLSIKLAAAQIAWQEMGECPVLLLDDVFSELDSKRRARLIETIAPYQAFITTADANSLKETRDANIYRIHQGGIFSK